MRDPYEVLGLPPEAADTEIRNRYLELTREFPPDRAPERFAEIRAAFDELRDPLSRLERTLFSLRGGDSIQDIAAEARARLRRARLPLDTLFSLADTK